MVASVAGFCDEIVAVDGAYALFPDALRYPASGPEQARVIVETARASGIVATVHVPCGPWWGGEVEKRTAMFRLAEARSEAWRDWYMVVDGDEVVTDVPGDLREILGSTEEHAGTGVLFHRPINHPVPGEYVPSVRELVEPSPQHRCLFRAVPGLRVERAHYVNVCEVDGETLYLRGRDDLMDVAGAVDVPGLLVEHRHEFRPWARSRAAQEYLQNRDAALVERVSEGV